jgi:hypothetical protein
MKRSDWLGLAVVAASLAGPTLCRRVYLEPHEWVGQCSSATPVMVRLPNGTGLAEQWQCRVPVHC